MKLMKNRRIYYIILPLLFLFTICTDVYARELELGEKTEEETQRYIENFNVSVSKTWTSRGRELLSYDVSQNGSILITFPDNKVGVFDENMGFLLELSFDCGGAYGAVWKGENILLVNLRADKVVECDREGNILGSYTVTGPSNYFSDIVEKRKREYGGYEYFCTNNKSGNGFYYTILERTSAENGKEILYKSGNLLDGIQFGICLFLLFGAGFIGLLILMALVDGKCTKAMDGKPFDGTRTYSTAYSVDDCIGLLSRKNIYDVLRYSFRQDKGNTAELTVTGHAKYTCPQIKACHQMVFEENGNTKISITNLPCSKPVPLPYIPQWWMDEFMAQKLDALPMDTEPENMGAGQI